MALFRKKPAGDPAKTSNRSLAPMSLALFATMFIAFGVLKATQMIQGVEKAEVSAPSLDSFIDQFTPSSDHLEGLLNRRLEYASATADELSLLTRDGVPIDALLAKPEGFGPFPGILLVHDGPASRIDTDKIHGQLGVALSQSLNAVVVTVDWRDSIIGEQDLTDVLSAVDWFKRGSEFKNQPLVMIGVGQGAYLSLLAAEQYASTIAAVVAINPVTDLASLREYQESATPGSGDALVYTAGCRSATDVPLCLSEDDVLSGVSRLTESLLLIHHTSYPAYPVTQSQALADALPDDSVYFITVDASQAGVEDEDDGQATSEDAVQPAPEAAVETTADSTAAAELPATRVDLTLAGQSVDILAGMESGELTTVEAEMVKWLNGVIAAAQADLATEAQAAAETEVEVERADADSTNATKSPIRIESP